NCPIKEQGTVLHVEQVVLKLLGSVDLIRAVRVAQLRPSRDARLDRMPFTVEGNFRIELRDELRPLAPGPDDAHLARGHIENLRQLVDPQLTDNASYASYAVVVGCGPAGTPVALRVLPHAAEFEELKRLAVHPHADLTIQNGGVGAVLELDGKRGEQHDG